MKVVLVDKYKILINSKKNDHFYEKKTATKNEKIILTKATAKSWNCKLNFAWKPLNIYLI